MGYLSGESIFKLYMSGCHTADFEFGGSGISLRRLEYETLQWNEYESFDVKSTFCDGLIPRCNELYEESEHIYWASEDCMALKGDTSYKKHLKLEGVVGGNRKEAWIWARQGAGLPIDVVTVEGRIAAFIMVNRDRCNVLVKPGYEEVTPLQLWKDPKISKDEYGIKHKGTDFVETMDGANLATEVWLPISDKQQEKFPTLLIRTPYYRLSNIEHWLRFVRRGYALVIQDVRGREDSNGEWVPYKYDIEDGNDTLNWIAGQTWSDGSVGMIGASYLGYVQWAAAANANPHLKAIVSMVTAGPHFIDIKRKGGVYTSGTLAWSFMMADQRMNREALKRDDWDEVVAMRPIKDIPKKVLGNDLHFWDEFMKHPDNDEFWQKLDWSLRSDKINVPSIIISGWYDDNGMGSTVAWEMNEKNQRENQKLIYGPWMHQYNSTREIHGVRFGENAIRYDLDVLCVRWFDRFLKNVDNGVEKEPVVQYYMVGENNWKEASKWPPQEACYKNFYIHSDGSANGSGGDGTLKMQPQAGEHFDCYTFNPEDPTPFLIDVSENELNVPENYKEVDKRKDVLVYTSEVLTEAVVIAGNIYAELYASSSARDTDWLVRLEDVDRDGNAIRLVDGILRARYRNSFEVPELLEPGKVEKYVIRMAKIANAFQKGHQIRVTVTSGAKNLAFPNQNTGNDPTADTEVLCAEQKVFHTEQYPSHVKLPIIDK